jgi:predicted component of type VI protein secretion system
MFLEIGAARHPIEPPGLVVGRGSNADLRIDDPGVSRRHVEFRVERVGPVVQLSVVDLGSTNGTTVDGARVQHAVLRDGSTVQIGSTRLVVRVGASAGGAPTPHEPYAAAGHPPQAYQPQPYEPQPYEPQPYVPPPDSGQRPPPDGPDQRHWRG